jgi:type II secretory pathway pseudopilin PulG
MKTNPTRQRKPSEEGYILVVVIFMLAILMLSLTVAAPVIKKEIQRDREVETMHRGKQYARAVKLYYKKFGAYPPTVDALVKQNEIRFLRKKYIDPTTGKDEWKIVRVGQQKTQTLGFFGQPLGAGASFGTGAMGGVPMGSPAGAGSMFGGANPATGAAPNGATGAPTGTPVTVDPNAAGAASAASGTGLTGQTFGGAPIMGFSPNSPKQSILVYKKKNHYNEWEFLYDPLADQMTQAGVPGTPAPPANGMTPMGSPSITAPTSPAPTAPAPPAQ